MPRRSYPGVGDGKRYALLAQPSIAATEWGLNFTVSTWSPADKPFGNRSSHRFWLLPSGGTVPTALGGTQVPGQLNAQAAANPPSPAAQIQAQNAGAGAGATAATSTTPTTTPTTTTPGVTNRVNVQTAPSTGVVPNTTVTAPRVNTSDSLVPPGATSRSPLPLTSASPVSGTSASPVVPVAPQAPGVGSSPPTAERVAPGRRPALN